MTSIRHQESPDTPGCFSLGLPPYAPELQLDEHLWALTNEALVNAHFADLDALEDAQLAHCARLQERRAVVHSTTLFHWWPSA